MQLRVSIRNERNQVDLYAGWTIHVHFYSIFVAHIIHFLQGASDNPKINAIVVVKATKDLKGMPATAYVCLCSIARHICMFAPI